MLLIIDIYPKSLDYKWQLWCEGVGTIASGVHTSKKAAIQQAINIFHSLKKSIDEDLKEIEIYAKW